MALERGDRPTPSPNRKGNAVAEMTKVRTSITPGEVIEVDERELVDLGRLGLIHSREGDEDWSDAEPVEVESGVITDGLDDQAETGDAERIVEPPAETETDKPIEPLAARVKRATKATVIEGESKGSE